MFSLQDGSIHHFKTDMKGFFKKNQTNGFNDIAFCLTCAHPFLSQAMETLMDCENLVLLGSGNKNGLPVFSFLVYNPQAGRFLHHNFVASLLNDLYGIQARGGCACAGPYAMVGPSIQVFLFMPHCISILFLPFEKILHYLTKTFTGLARVR